MPSSLIEIIVTLLLIVCNGVFSLSETAFVSARRARLQQRADSGDARAQAALDLMHAPNRFLSTVQISITLICILAGAFGGATLAQSLAAYLGQLPLVAPYAETLSLVIVVTLITYLSLVIGELMPKRIVLNASERIVTAVVCTMQLLSKLASPLIAFLSVSTEAVLRRLRVRPSTEPPVTEEEIKQLLEQGRQAGIFEETEHDLAERVFHLGDRRVNALMTPRIYIVWIDVADRVDPIHQTILARARTRFPVCQDTFDNVLGIVNVRDLDAQLATRQPLDLRAILQSALFVPESTRAFSLLERFKQTGQSMALVVQEYGEIGGVITLKDMLEALVGDLPTAGEPVEQEAMQREDGSWLLDGAISVEEVEELLGIESLPEQDSRGYETLGGLVMRQLGRMPVVTDAFDWAGWRFEVMDMDGRRVDKVLATPLRPPHTNR